MSTTIAEGPQDVLEWKVKTRLEKRLGEWTPEQIDTDPAAAQALVEFEKMFGEDAVLEREGNLLMYGGASCLWQSLIGNGTTTAGQALTYFNNAQAGIGSGDSSTAAAATQTDMQAATNKMRKAMDATYPQHTDGVVAGSATITFRSTFATADANWAWQEWGIFNSTSAGVGRMLNRKVESLGTKTSAATWTFTVTITLA